MNTRIARIAGVFSLSAAALLLSGCASIVHGGARKISMASQPSGARFSIVKEGTQETVSSGVTPMTVSLSPKGGYFRGQSYTVHFAMAGYDDATVAIRPEMSGWYFGNILLGGLIGMLAVDPVTGAMWNLSPDKIEQNLSEEQAAVIKDGKGFMVVLISQVTDSEKANLVRIN